MKTISYAYAIFTLFLVCFFTLTGARAFAAERIISSREDIAIAFFKTGNVLPNFESWAKASEAYKKTPPTKINAYIDKEKERLQKRWLDYNPQEDFIVFKVPVKLSLSVDESGKYWMQIVLTDKGKTQDYFTVVFQGYYIAVIPQKSEEVLLQNLRPEQFTALSERFGASLTGSAELYIELQPAQAYTNAPHKIDNRDQWVLLSDIVGMTLVNKNAEPFWNYSASWYVSPKTVELNNLYKAGDK